MSAGSTILAGGIPLPALCANIVVASTDGERHAIFEFDQARNSEKSFTA